MTKIALSVQLEGQETVDNLVALTKSNVWPVEIEDQTLFLILKRLEATDKDRAR